MAWPAILSLDECRDTQRRVEIRQRLHDRFAHWLERLEEGVKAPQPNLEPRTQAILALRQELTQAVTEGLMEQTHRALLEQRTAACRPCGHTLSARGRGERTVETLVGSIRLQRLYVDCARCQCSSSPLDAALKLTGLPLSTHTAHNLPQEVAPSHVKKSPGLLCQRVEVRYALMVQHLETWPVSVRCEVLEVSRSGCYAYRQGQATMAIDVAEVT
jgi:hypothetical protein